MYSPAVLEAFDAVFTSSPVRELEPQLIAKTIDTANDSTNLFESEDDCDDDIASQKHWYLHTREWQHRQSLDSTSDVSEILEPKSLPVPLFDYAADKRPMNVEVQVVEIEENRA